MSLDYEFNWGMLFEEPARQEILEAVVTTLALALLSWAVSLLIGGLIAALRSARSLPLRFVGGLYVEVFRNIPLLVQMFIWFFVFPLLLPNAWRLWWNNLADTPFWTAVIALSLYTGSRVAEHIRSGLSSIPRGQFDAARSTGLTAGQMYRNVILPYAVRVVIPSLSIEFVSIFKNTALAMPIGVAEVTSAANQIESMTFHGIEAYGAASVVYLVINGVVIFIMARLEKVLHVPGLIARE